MERNVDADNPTGVPDGRFDRLMVVVLALLVVACAIVVLGETLERVLGIGPGLLFAVVLVLAMSLLMGLGIVRGARGHLLRASLAVGVTGVLAVIVTIFWLDRSSATTNDRVLGMLPATALMVFGVFGVSFCLLASYVAFFGQAVFGPQEVEKLANFSRAEGSNSTINDDGAGGDKSG